MCDIAAKPAGLGIKRSRKALSNALLINPARTLQLVAHAAGSPDLRVKVCVKTTHSAADRLAQIKAALAAGNRLLHHVDRKRNHRARPAEVGCGWLTKYQR